MMTNRKPDDVSAIKLAIRDAGLRATPARIATLSLLQSPGAPLTHAEVAEELQNLGIDKATVFRNLNDLATAGLLRRTELVDRVWRFELKSSNHHPGTEHPHFLCVDCGVVACMDDVKLTAGSLKFCQEFGEVTEILLRGHCNACS